MMAKERLTTEQLREYIIRDGYIDVEEFDDWLLDVQDAAFDDGYTKASDYYEQVSPRP